jgi:hypothetical protein
LWRTFYHHSSVNGPSLFAEKNPARDIRNFIAWYCSEPRLAFNRIVVVRYRIHLEARNLAAATINQRLAAAASVAQREVIFFGTPFIAVPRDQQLHVGVRDEKPGILLHGRFLVRSHVGFVVRKENVLDVRREELLDRLQWSCPLQEGPDGLRERRDYAMLAMLLG